MTIAAAIFSVVFVGSCGIIRCDTKEDVAYAFASESRLNLTNGSQVKCCCKERHKKCVLAIVPTGSATSIIESLANRQGCAYLVGRQWHSYLKSWWLDGDTCFVEKSIADELRAHLGDEMPTQTDVGKKLLVYAKTIENIQGGPASLADLVESSLGATRTRLYVKISAGHARARTATVAYVNGLANVDEQVKLSVDGNFFAELHKHPLKIEVYEHRSRVSHTIHGDPLIGKAIKFLTLSDLIDDSTISIKLLLDEQVQETTIHLQAWMQEGLGYSLGDSGSSEYSGDMTLNTVGAVANEVITHRAEFMEGAEDWEHDAAAYSCKAASKIGLAECTQSLDSILAARNGDFDDAKPSPWSLGEAAVLYPWKSINGVVMSDHRPLSVTLQGFGDIMPALFTWNIEGFGSYKAGYNGSGNASVLIKRRQEMKQFVSDIKMNSTGSIVALQEAVLKSKLDLLSATRFLGDFQQALGGDGRWKYFYDNSTGAVFYDSRVWELMQVVPIARNGKIEQVTKYSTYCLFRHRFSDKLLDIVNVHLWAAPLWSSGRSAHVKELKFIWSQLEAQLKSNFYAILDNRSLIFLGDFNDLSDKEDLLRESFQAAFPKDSQKKKHGEL